MSYLRRPIVLMVLGALLLGVAAVMLATRETETVEAVAPTCDFPPCRASANPVPARGYEGAYVAADPADGDHVVVTDHNVLENRCGFHTTFDRGREWTDGFFDLPPGYLGCRLNGPSGGHVASGSVGLGSGGRVYGVFASAHEDDGGRQSVLLATSTDGGATFAPATVAMAPTGPDVGLARPLMTVVAAPSGGADTLLVSAWACRPAERGTQCDAALFARSDDGGATFSDPVAVNDPPAGQNPSAPVMDADGVVYQTFQRRFSDGPVELFLATSEDGGETFAQSLVDRQLQIGIQHDPAKLALDPASGALYAVWADNRTGRTQIFLRKSNDKGVSWGEQSVLLSPDRLAGSGRSPSISVAPNGRIDVVYYHTGPSAEVQDFDDVYWSYSFDGGDTFVSRQVNEAPIDRTKGYSGPAASIGPLGNHYPPTVSSLDDAAYVVWSDTRAADDVTNTQDVVLRRMEVPGAAPP